MQNYADLEPRPSLHTYKKCDYEMIWNQFLDAEVRHETAHSI